MALFASLTILGVFLSAALVGWMRRYALHHAILDHPTARGAHQVATPRGGGVGIVAVVVLGVLLAGWAGWLSGRVLLAFLPAAFAMAWVGWLDDRQGLSVRWRAVVHALAALWLLIGLGVPAWPPFLPALLLWPLWLLALVWLSNLYNFMDGLDGLAAAEAVFMGSAMAMLAMLADARPVVVLGMLIASASLGFLYWNRPPARIFMGDVGSGSLGLALGALLLLTEKHFAQLVWPFLILSAGFWVDATATLLFRIWRGEVWYAAHSQHAYQHLARRWRSHRAVLLAQTGFNFFWLLPLAMLAWWYPRWATGLTALALAPLLALWWRAGGGRP